MSLKGGNSIMDSVAIYCRLSDEDRNKSSATDDSESIQNQKLLLTKYAVERGWAIYNIYSDDDYSGLDKERPEFNKMLNDAEDRKFNIILCKHQSRFTRDMELVEKYLHGMLPAWGIRFVSVTDNADTSEKGNKKSRQINGLVNEWYCEDISEAIRATFNAKREAGKFIGSFASYGYIKDPKDKNKLIIDEEAANVVKQIYDWYLQGNGTQHVAYMLNEKGIPNPTKYKQNQGLNFRNVAQTDGFGLWNKVTVKRILKNELYLGNMVQSRTTRISYKDKRKIELPPSRWIIVKDTHEAIVNEKTFDEVQKRMASRVRSTGKGTTHIFASKVRCLDCGSTMNKVSQGKYSYLRCKLYCVDPKKELCTRHSISLDKLTSNVSEKVRNYINKYCDDDYLARELMKEQDINNRVTTLERNIKALDKRNKEIEITLTSAYRDKANGNMSEIEYRIIGSNLTAEMENQPAKRKELGDELERVKNSMSELDKWIEAVQKYKDFEQLTPGMVNELIDYIEVGEKNKGTGEQKIVIHWNI